MSALNDISGPDKSNIQGMILRGFTHPYSCHMIFQFKDQAGAGSFIKAIFPFVQSAENWGDDKPDEMINIGLTYSGIVKASKLTPKDMKSFPWVFKEGPTSAGSQGSLNDCGPSAIQNWVFGNQTQQVDCVVHAYGMTPETLEQLVSAISAAAVAGGLTEYLPVENGTKRLQEYALVPRYSVHFGYQDGIDQPALGSTNPMDPSDVANFLIGYAAESAFNPAPNDGSNAAVFAKDGCYNAFRMLSQDSEVFDNFLEDNTANIAKILGQPPKYAKEWLAAKLNGRWRNGSPLELSPDEPEEKTSRATDFGYAGDTDGMKCPFAAHTRVGNPRDEQILTQDEPVPRLIRRGMAYGAPPVLNDYKGDRGLIGLFLCGALDTQFELICSWINTTNFSPLFPSQRTQDALLANRCTPNADNSFTIPSDKGPVVINNMPQFVVTKGTAYCLLPSLSTLKSLAGLT
jgi:deferrochelatase/peroxidase EfeB